ncbi:hypothetical protein [Actinomadura macrotermitis]|uniref:hypothetical protein n=1 Tax=Actinomadura macrotermitis TaxID=2585200 RepID=UPI001297772F|nr:hypothetical protein [Actinomadura macrotermitis]
MAVLLAVGGVLAVASMRTGGRRPPRRWTVVGLWFCCALAGVGTFGFVMNVVMLVFAGEVDDGPVFAVQLLCAVGTVLFAGAALAFQRGTAGACALCGRVHAQTGTMKVAPPPAPAPRAVRRAAWVGTLAFLPYIYWKSTWALGGSFAGVTADEAVAEFKRNGASELVLTLERYGLDFTTLSALLGIFLLMGLTHSWGQVFPRWAPGLTGRRVPRWLPLTPAWLGTMTLAPYGVIAGIGYLLPPVLGLADLPDVGLTTGWNGWLIAACGLGAFGPYGIALGIAAWSYQRRTRPLCVTSSEPAVAAEDLDGADGDVAAPVHGAGR